LSGFCSRVAQRREVQAAGPVGKIVDERRAAGTADRPVHHSFSTPGNTIPSDRSGGSVADQTYQSRNGESGSERGLEPWLLVAGVVDD
jgi:hypothetical protein